MRLEQRKSSCSVVLVGLGGDLTSWGDLSTARPRARARDPRRGVWKPGEEAWVKSFDLVSTGDIVRPGSKNLTHG